MRPYFAVVERARKRGNWPRITKFPRLSLKLSGRSSIGVGFRKNRSTVNSLRALFGALWIGPLRSARRLTGKSTAMLNKFTPGFSRSFSTVDRENRENQCKATQTRIARGSSIHQHSRAKCKTVQSCANPHFPIRRPLLYPVELRAQNYGGGAIQRRVRQVCRASERPRQASS
jgi:hypothetical protein